MVYINGVLHHAVYTLLLYILLLTTCEYPVVLWLLHTVQVYQLVAGELVGELAEN